ncbi:MAG TPA: transaldolase family protein, partial [Pararhizobium sp.]|nr:transaldolase family protein [Pararhizobium sp.]
MLRFFLDSADRNLWETLVLQGWVHGATTNPTLLERAGLTSSVQTALDLVRSATDLGLKELQVQSWGGDHQRLADNGRALASLSPIVTVKVPATADGLRAAAQIKAEGYRVTLTACYTARQCAAARVLGLDYVAPYYGRMIEAGIDPDARLDAMKTVAGDSLRILIASIRRAE